MPRIHRIALSILALSLAVPAAGCKKKQQDIAASSKTTEGSAVAAPGSAAPAGSASEQAGSAQAAAVAAGSSADVAPAPATTKTIIETAKAAGTFTTFLKAVDAAGLTERLNGPGPFTVFAPTDEAFSKVPAKDLDALLADKAKLEAVLQRHVVVGTLVSKDVTSQKALKTVQGDELSVDATSGVTVGGAKVTTPDITASNGVIHAIDKVLLPTK